MKIALVGPTGVYGRALVPMLLESGHAPRLLARSAEKAHKLFPQVSDVVACDLLEASTAELASALEGCEAVAHIATAIPRDFSVPNVWERNTRLRTEGVRKLLDASLQAGVGRYIQQSITMAYPDRGDAWISEDLPLNNDLEQARVNTPVISMEQMVKETPPEKMSWCILRGASFVGKDTFQEDLIERLHLGQEVVPCDGSYFISLIHVADMASATLAAIERAPAGSVFNINDEPLRYGEYLDRLADSLGAPRPKRDASLSCPPSWRCSNQAAREKLGWRPTHNLIP